MKKLLSVLLTIVMLVVPVAEMTAFAAPSAVEVADSAMEFVQMPMEETAILAAESGWCGDTADNLTWTLDDEGTLTISGTGNMATWYSEYDIPWYNERLSIKKLVVEDGVTSISYMAFRECTNLETVTIGSGLSDMGSYCFYNCTSLKSITVDENNTNFSSDSYGVLFNYDLLIQYPVGNERTSYEVPYGTSHICAEAFKGAKNLESVTISNSVRFVENDSFNGCEALSSIEIPDSVEELSGTAFNNCSSLKTITIGSGLRAINNECFDVCEALEKIIVDEDNECFSSDSYGVLYNKDKTELIKYPMASTKTSYEIPDTVEVIREEAFANVSNLESVVIPDSVKSIGTYAFYWSENLEDITMGSNVEKIGEYAFHNTAYYNNYDNWENEVLYLGNCLIAASFSEYDASYTIKDGTRTIADSAFGWSGTGSVTIPDSVTSIGNWAFYGSSALTDITIGTNVEHIGREAFNNTAFYENENNWNGDLLYLGNCLVASRYISGSCDVKSGTRVIADYVFETRDNLTSVTLPDSVETIGEGAFYNCHKLSKLTMSPNVTSIGNMAFYNCFVLEEMVIPDGVKAIGRSAFEWCQSLKSITIGSGVTSIGDYAFYCCNALSSIVLPENVKTIGVEAFCSSGLESATILGATKIGRDAFAYCNNLTIYAPENSAAHKYAKENWLDFVVREGSSYTVTYNANGGTGAPESQIKEKNKTLTLSKVVPTRKGYTFKGWSTTLGGKVEYDPGDKYTANKSVTLYAVWQGVVIPDEYKTGVEIVDGAMEALGISVEADGRDVTVTFSGITVKDKYITNHSSSELDNSEYFWEVTIESPEAIYSVGTVSWAFDPGRNEEKTLEEMDNSVWKFDGDSFNWVCNADMSHTSDSITWTFSIPEDLDFDFSDTKRFVASYNDIDDNYIERIYVVGGDANGNLIVRADAVEFTSLKSTSLAVGKTLSLSAKAYCKNGEKPESTKVVLEIVDGEEYATLDAKGKLKGIAPGKVTIRASAEEGTETAYADVVINVCIPATKVTLNKTKASMITGGKGLCLEATLLPENNTDTLTWSVDKPEIATVDEYGVVTAHSAGKVKVTALAGSGKSATCSITVGEPATKVEFSSLKSTSLAVGKTLSLKAKASRDDKVKPVSTNVVFEIIEGHEYATIDAKGKLKGIATGEVVVRATAEAGTEDAYEDVVIRVCVPATKLSLNMKTAAIDEDEELQLKAVTAPDNNTDVVIWTSENEDIAVVDENGLVTALSTGIVKITATTGSGKSASCTVTVGVPATKVTLNTTKASMINGGKDLCLEATLLPENNTDTLTWSVDKPEIATVDEYGVVTAHSAGKVKVTALAGSGKKATCSITVGEPATKVEFSSLKSTSLAVGKTLSLKAKASRDDKVKPVSTNVVFEIIEGHEYATIDAKGKLKGIATGEVVVRATAEAGTETAFAEVVINVCIPATKVVLNIKKATVSAGEKVYLQATMSPETNTDTLFWSSSNESVAVVDDEGVVTTLKEGSVKITATSGSGKKATCTVKVEKAAVPATFSELILTDVSYEFVEDEYIVEANPGAVGGMEISATVMGPSDVKEVLIANWGTDISDMSQKEIYEEAVWYANMWKSHGFEVGDYNRIPFEIRTMHPIDEDEFDLDLQVLLIGLDKDCNAVGYYILEQN